jgi:hypothetical protein
LVEFTDEYGPGTLLGEIFWAADLVPVIIINRKDVHMAYPPNWSTLGN